MKSILKWVLCLVIILGLVPVINTIDPTVIPIVQFNEVINKILAPFDDEAWGSSIRRRRVMQMQRRRLAEEAIIAYESYGEGEGLETTSITVTAPSGIQDGDMLVAFICIDNSNVTFNNPSGWTTVDTQNGGVAGCSATLRTTSRIAYRVASSESGNYTWDTFSSSQTSQGYIVRLSNPGGSQSWSRNSQCGEDPAVCPSISHSANSVMLASQCGNDGDALDSTGENCAGFSSTNFTCIDTDAAGGSGGVHAGVAYYETSGGGTSGTASFDRDSSQSSRNWTLEVSN